MGGGWRKLHNEGLHNVCSSPYIIRMIESKKIRWAGRKEKRNTCRILVGKSEGKRLRGYLDVGWRIMQKWILDKWNEVE
jgi:hypothetical protein